MRSIKRFIIVMALVFFVSIQVYKMLTDVNNSQAAEHTTDTIPTPTLEVTAEPVIENKVLNVDQCSRNSLLGTTFVKDAIARYDIEGLAVVNEKILVGEGVNRHPDPSPDGCRFVWTQYGTVRIGNIDGTGAYTLTNNTTGKTIAGSYTVWADNGTIGFISNSDSEFHLTDRFATFERDSGIKCTDPDIAPGSEKTVCVTEDGSIIMFEIHTRGTYYPVGVKGLNPRFNPTATGLYYVNDGCWYLDFESKNSTLVYPNASQCSRDGTVSRLALIDNSGQLVFADVYTGEVVKDPGIRITNHSWVYPKPKNVDTKSLEAFFYHIYKVAKSNE